MRLQSSCSAGKNPQVPAGLALTLLKAPLTRLPAGLGPGRGGPGRWRAPWRGWVRSRGRTGIGSRRGGRGEGMGLRSNLFPCAQGRRTPAPRLGAGPALPSSPPPSGSLRGSTVGCAGRGPVALPQTSARAPRLEAPQRAEPQSA